MVIKAVCVLAGDVVKGVINLSQNTPDCPVEIEGQITGLTEGEQIMKDIDRRRQYWQTMADIDRWWRTLTDDDRCDININLTQNTASGDRGSDHRLHWRWTEIDRRWQTLTDNDGCYINVNLSQNTPDCLLEIEGQITGLTEDEQMMTDIYRQQQYWQTIADIVRQWQTRY